MREQLIQYVELLFAGAPGSEDIRAEIMQNTLDRYDDLIAQGKTPEAAYRLAISGIGDINEILSGNSPEPQPVSHMEASEPVPAEPDTVLKRILRAAGIALYILCPIPLFVLGDMGMDNFGLCGTLALVAVATMLMILGGKKKIRSASKCESAPLTPRQELRKSINSMIWAIGLALYFILSFATGAWHITWVVFPIIGAVEGLVKAILDLKEANDHEN